MKKLIYIIIIIFASTSIINAAEKRDCSGIKKLSKAFIACKSGNLKTGIVNTGSKIKKGVGSKIKRKDKNNQDETKKVKKKKSKGLFKNLTKQYPKGTKKK